MRSAPAPCRWSSSRSPQMPVRSVPRSQNRRMSEPSDGIARPQPFIVISAPGRQPGDPAAADVHRAAVVLEPRGDLDDVLAGQVRDRC